MTSTASLGVMSLFLVDLADIFYLSLLGELEVAAAIGFAGSILFFTTSVGIGLMISMAALVSRAIGARRRLRAKRMATNVLFFGFCLTSLLAIIVFLAIPGLLSLLGAEGRAHELAQIYLRIIIPTMPIMAMGLGLSGYLRALGDARRAMMLTVFGALVNAILDPILIFGLDMGIAGAATATVVARTTGLIVGIFWIQHVHHGFVRFHWRGFLPHASRISGIALPAILTNIATPIGTAYVTASMAAFGVGAVAGMAIITKLTPVAFGVVFALSGAVGPIHGQNLGAGRLDRVRETLSKSFMFMVIFILVMSGLLFLAQGPIISAFRATGQAAELISLFCTWLALTFIFPGALFVANASFNNLGRPTYSTFFNWGRNTLGTIPFVFFGAQLYGAAGILIGQAAGSMVFGVLAFIVARRHVHGLEMGTVHADEPARWRRILRLIPLWPQITPRG
jgi:putative MATE family efflux protein